MSSSNEMGNFTRSPPFVFLFSTIAFVLHFAWELVQCSAFFRHVQNPANLEAMITAASGDVLMIWTVFLLMAAGYRSLTWFNSQWNFRLIFSIVGFSLLLAVFVELWAVRTERWIYTENNPLLPFLGVSILPLMQMALINPVSMYGSKIFLARFLRT